MIRLLGRLTLQLSKNQFPVLLEYTKASFNHPAFCCARTPSGHATAAPPSAASNSRRPMVTHTPLPREVRKGNDTTPSACSLHVREGGDATAFPLGPRMRLSSGDVISTGRSVRKIRW
jgi:hypothetical protein